MTALSRTQTKQNEESLFIKSQTGPELLKVLQARRSDVSVETETETRVDSSETAGPVFVAKE